MLAVMEYRQASHTKYKIEYHFVWVTKYRFQVLVEHPGRFLKNFPM